MKDSNDAENLTEDQQEKAKKRQSKQKPPRPVVNLFHFRREILELLTEIRDKL